MAYDFIQRMMEEIPSDKPVEYVTPTFTYLSRQAFDNFLMNLEAYNDNQIFDFIKTNLEFIQQSIMQRDMLVVNMFHNVRFVKAFSLVVTNMPVDTVRQFCVNKICYDYFTSDAAVDKIKAILMETAKRVNSEEIRQLMSIGLDVDTACNLAMCRFSSINEKVNIKRLNFVICSKGSEIMTTQMIVWIIEKLFDHIGELFTTTMLEYYVTAEGMENDSDFMETMSSIYSAILTIVNNMSMIDIRRLIEYYLKEWDHAGRPRVKVSLRTLSGDYGRILQVVEMLERQFNIYLP